MESLIAHNNNRSNECFIPSMYLVLYSYEYFCHVATIISYLRFMLVCMNIHYAITCFTQLELSAGKMIILQYFPSLYVFQEQ
jgi:hypothetical protein